MHFIMYALSNHAGVLQNVMPIDLLVQSVVLFDGVVFSYPPFRTSSRLSDLHTHVKVCTMLRRLLPLQQTVVLSIRKLLENQYCISIL